MFSVLLKGMLIIFMLAGVVGIIYGIIEIWHTIGWVSASTGKAKATFAGYHREISKSTSIKPYSPANPKMSSTTTSYAVATYPEFIYTTEHGHQQIIRESKVHVFSVYKPGEEVDILLSSGGNPRMASFYSLYFRDLLIFGMALVALILSIVFWKFAVPLISQKHQIEVYSGKTSTGADSVQTQLSDTTIEDEFNSILKEAWNYQVGPVKMKHILYGFLGLFVLVMILSFLFPSHNP